MPVWVSWIADIIGILGGFFAFFAWIQALRVRKLLEQEKQRQNQKIRVILNYSSQVLELPVELRRNEFTRAEILGRIGMIPMKNPGDRFGIKFLNSPEFLHLINEIRESSGDSILTIPCTQEEITQFDIS